MVIIYRVSSISYLIGKMLVKVPYIGMANIMAGKKVVPELIQKEANANNITAEVGHLLRDNHYYQKVCEDLTSIKEELGKPGASKRAAQIAVNMLSH
jgi:lipid-A-disaccharide synthase